VRKLMLKSIVVLAIAAAPTFAIAQDGDAAASQTARAADSGDRGNWGWMGLLGLAGLLGLKRRDRDEAVSRDRATAAR